MAWKRCPEAEMIYSSIPIRYQEKIVMKSHAHHVANTGSRSTSTLAVAAVCLMFLLSSAVPALADHVHHLWYNNAEWQDQDLTALTAGGIAYGTSLTAFRTAGNNQLHVYYVGTDYHVHQLYYNNSYWSDEDLTAFVGGPTANPFGIAGFAIGNLQYVFYVEYTDVGCCTNGHVHELNYNNAGWSDLDLTASAVGGVGAGFYTPGLVAFSTPGNNQFHVYFLDDVSGDLNQLYFNGTEWSDQDLSSFTGAHCYIGWGGPPYYTGYIAGFAVGNEQHLFCGGATSPEDEEHLMHIYYNNSTWTYEDVTAKVGGTPVGFSSMVAGFRYPGTTQMEVYAVTADTHVHQYTFKKAKWTDMDMTVAMGAPTYSGNGGATAFPTAGNNQFHIYYQPSSEVYQLYFNGTSWSAEDLTEGAGTADYSEAPMAGFAVGNLQHVFYLGTE